MSETEVTELVRKAKKKIEKDGRKTLERFFAITFEIKFAYLCVKHYLPHFYFNFYVQYTFYVDSFVL